MNDFRLTVPVALIIFNRPDTTRRVFERIREAKPEKLYIIADAPRVGRKDDEDKVAEVRKYVEEHIDWECEIHKNYAENNMGCRDRVSSGITWVLENEERTIVIEDDVLPCMDFFRYMQETMDYYNDNPRVMMVSGTNLMKNVSMEGQYTFTCYTSVWGWGTWKRAWDGYDRNVSDWPEVKKSKSLKKVQSGLAYVFLKRHIDQVYEGKDTWDYQWDYHRWKRGGLGIVPSANLIENIGMDREDATHTSYGHHEDFTVGKMNFPINFDKNVERDIVYDKAYIKENFGIKSVTAFVKKKLGKKQ